MIIAEPSFPARFSVIDTLLLLVELSVVDSSVDVLLLLEVLFCSSSELESSSNDSSGMFDEYVAEVGSVISLFSSSFSVVAS